MMSTKLFKINWWTGKVLEVYNKPSEAYVRNKLFNTIYSYNSAVNKPEGCFIDGYLWVSERYHPDLKKGDILVKHPKLYYDFNIEETEDEEWRVVKNTNNLIRVSNTGKFLLNHYITKETRSGMTRTYNRGLRPLKLHGSNYRYGRKEKYLRVTEKIKVGDGYINFCRNAAKVIYETFHDVELERWEVVTVVDGDETNLNINNLMKVDAYGDKLNKKIEEIDSNMYTHA